MNRPNPEPERLRPLRPRLKGVKSVVCSSGGMPGPRSRTTTRAVRLWDSTRNVTGVPVAAYDRVVSHDVRDGALEMSGSARTYRRSGASIETRPDSTPMLEEAMARRLTSTRSARRNLRGSMPADHRKERIHQVGELCELLVHLAQELLFFGFRRPLPCQIGAARAPASGPFSSCAVHAMPSSSVARAGDRGPPWPSRGSGS